MSVYTSLGVTVSPEASLYFLRLLKTLSITPDHLTRVFDGSVNAVWEEHNHFDSYSSEDYRTVMSFLQSLDEKDYVYESVTEDCMPEIGGGYYFGFARVVTYKLDGDPIGLDDVVSENRRIGFFRRKGSR